MVDGPIFDVYMVWHVLHEISANLEKGGGGEPYDSMKEAGIEVIAHYYSHVFQKKKALGNDYKSVFPKTGLSQFKYSGDKACLESASRGMISMVFPPRDNLKHEMMSSAAVTSVVFDGLEEGATHIDLKNTRHRENHGLVAMGLLALVDTGIAGATLVSPAAAVAAHPLGNAESIYEKLVQRKYKDGVIKGVDDEYWQKMKKEAESGRRVSGLTWMPNLDTSGGASKAENKLHDFRSGLGTTWTGMVEGNRKKTKGDK